MYSLTVTKWTLCLIVLLFTTMSVSKQFTWPNNALAAVNLAYDDALNSQLDIAIPQLDKYGLKGSFYVTLASPSFKTRRNEWKAISLQGHELGNHTIHHACRGSLPNREWVNADNDLDNKSVAELVSEVKSANLTLTQLDNSLHRTFTLPCTDKLANGQDYLNVIAPLFVGIKSHVNTIPKTMSNVNLKDSAVISAENLTGKQLIALVEKAGELGTMVNFTFHGVGGDYLAITSLAHKELLEFLAHNKEKYWVDTFRNISLHIKNKKE